jgi:hypothetical protein
MKFQELVGKRFFVSPEQLVKTALDNNNTLAATCDTHSTLVFWLKFSRKPLKICDCLSDLMLFSDYYNELTFCIENFQSFRYGLCLCLKKVHFLGMKLENRLLHGVVYRMWL